MKSVFIFCFALATVVSGFIRYVPTIDPQDELQQIANGYWEQAGLSDPTTVIPCFTGDSAQQTIDFLGNLTLNLANGAYLKIPNIVYDYMNNLPSDIKTTLQNNAEVKQVEAAYGLDKITLTQMIERIEKYVIAHYSTISSQFQELNNELTTGQYETYGKNGGALLQAVMAQDFPAPRIDPQDELQQIANGFWEQAGLSDPTTVLACFVDDSPQQTVDFLVNLTAYLASAQYLKIPNLVLSYKSNLPSTVVPCLVGNTEVKQVEAVYGTGNVSLTQLISKFEKYIIANYQTIPSQFQELNTQLTAGNYDTYGRDAGALLQAIMAGGDLSSPSIDPQDELQQIANGFWEHAGLSDPTTVLACFVGDSPQLTVDFLGNLTSYLASRQYLKIPDLVLNFENEEPTSITPCLQSNAEVKQVEAVYGTGNITVTQLISKFEKYIINNYQSVQGELQQLNNDLTAENYDTFGRDAGTLLQAVLAGDE